MKDYIIKDPWKIIEEGFFPEFNKISESLFSLGNGHFGQRANFEETYSGESLQGNYIGGVYYPDKTKVGWWKNGYPAYFAKVLNSCNWIGLRIIIGEEELDLAKVKQIDFFRRELDMKEGVLRREVKCILHNGAEVHLISSRFCSMKSSEIGALEYSLEVTNFSGNVTITSFLDFDVINEDTNYDEKFWIEKEQSIENPYCYVTAETKKTAFLACVAMSNSLSVNNINSKSEIIKSSREKYVEESFTLDINSGDKITLQKLCNLSSTRNHERKTIVSSGLSQLAKAETQGYKELLIAHINSWQDKWAQSDIVIENDIASQQAVRFNIFQLNQTYTGEDSRLNIGPKGFTGEKYGGSTYWDTEAYCLPFYLSTSPQAVAKNLLLYRYNHLDKAIENAEKLGFTGGAALYPMVTMNGEECHNEWEITFEEIHRNGAIAFAIYDYVNYTGDKKYLDYFGAKVLIGISRFWAQRFNWSSQRNQYVMLGVTGPNEYENNVNNNWYTSYIAKWCLEYTSEILLSIKETNEDSIDTLVREVNFDSSELDLWKQITENIYFPESKELGIFLQQDNYLDKEQILVKDLPEIDRPLNQKWSWDRILRSCFIKQADVLQGMYLFEEDFSIEQHKANFLFYESRTVHESSLSPCVHSILASKLGMQEKAYEMYLRTARLDLDDYNNDTEDGLHITSMAGTWMSVVKGFAGQRVKEGKLHFSPSLPDNWDKLSFRINFREWRYLITISKDAVGVENLSDTEGIIFINEKIYNIEGGKLRSMPIGKLEL